MRKMIRVFDFFIFLLAGLAVNYITEVLKSLEVLQDGLLWNFVLSVVTLVLWATIHFIRGKMQKKNDDKMAKDKIEADRIAIEKRNKMVTSIRDEMLNLELEVLRFVYEWCMKKYYDSLNWLTDTENHIKSIQNTNNKYKNNYTINSDIVPFSLEALDVTTLCSLISYDYKNYVCIGDSQDFRGHISKIRTDKNMVESHIGGVKPTLSYYCRVLNALNNLSVFLDYLLQNENDATFVTAVTEIKEKTAAQVQKWREEFNDDFSENNIEMAIMHEMQEVISLFDEEMNEYIPLSYDEINSCNDEKKDADKMEDIEQIFFDCLPKGGMAIVANAGYGKSWALRRIAGILAEKYITELGNDNDSDETSFLPIYIEMGLTTEERIEQIVQKRLSLNDENEAFKFIQNNNICFIVDAFDEAREDVREKISAQLKQYSNKENIKLLCSARGGEFRRFFPAELPVYSIFDLTDNKIEQFFEKLKDSSKIELAKKIWFEGENSDALKMCKNAFTVTCFIELVKEGDDVKKYCTDDQIIFNLMKSLIRREIGVTQRKIEAKTGKSALFCTEAEVEEFLIYADNILGVNKQIMSGEFNRRMEEKLILESSHSDVSQITKSMIQANILRKPTKHTIAFSHEMFRRVVARFASNEDEVGI